jgi:two-component system CheB/CheR fusion protein
MTFPIVGIAASAGGLEAASELLGALPSRCGMAFILVQHMDPDRESLLAEILADRTRLEVVQATNGLEVEADHVYVIPPNATITIDAGHLTLAPRPTTGPLRFRPADTLLRSLAEGCGDRAIAVVLSGGDADGSLGLEAVKHAGGITFAQDPATARFPSMPNSAIETRAVDFVLNATEIAAELVRLVGHPYLRSVALSPGEPPSRATAPAAVAPEDKILQQVFRRLRAAHGVDFSHYKRNTLRRRLSRRMALHRIEDPAEYTALIERDSSEAEKLYQDFLIRVTGFFRDPEAFESLACTVFPRVVEGHSGRDPLRIWVPGCATGEEVYSIAMALVEWLGDRPGPAGLQIFGTDVSEAAVEKARAGVYLDTISQDVSAERLERFFVKQADHYRIAKSIRDACIFARHDVTRDPPFSRLDLVSCRNLLIYLDAPTQRRVMRVFHYALKPHGFLMLGPSESIGQANDLFDLADRHSRLYTRRPTPPTFEFSNTVTPIRPERDGAKTDETGVDEPDSQLREADRVLLARFAPASVVVDDALNILQFRGETGAYFQHASGPPSSNLSRVVRPELLVEISPAIREARENDTSVRRTGLRVNGMTDVTIEVVPLPRLSARRCYLILFDDATRASEVRRAARDIALSESEKDRLLAQAQREVGSIREYLQATMEEHEAVKEELKSAHEEVLSANEEFQSTNEELETAKEELQSANEELTTTNDELRNRNRDLGSLNAELASARDEAERTSAYADAIIETVREPLVVLDSTLRVLRANRAFYSDFRVRPEETDGRLLHELGGGEWNIPRIREQLEAVLARDEMMADVEVEEHFPVIGHRVICLNARKIASNAGRYALILLAMEDVTERRERLESLREGSRRKDEFLAMLAHELRNPLTPITHAIHILRRADTDGSARHLHEIIERQTQRLSRLVDELLDVARISHGMIGIKHEPVDMAAVVRNAVESITPQIERFEHTVTLSLPEVSVFVDGDALRLEQVVTNLLENAAKYTERGGRINVTLSEADGKAVLSVRDTGIGLAPETTETIFDTFSQVDNSLARERGGLGLGLSVVRRVLEMHGGSIAAHSPGLGQGSEFVVKLPLLLLGASLAPSPDPAVAPVVTHDRSDLHTHRASPGLADAVPRRVLIVDDNADSAMSLGMLVGSWGHEIAIAGDGVKGLEIAAKFKPDFALVDIGMPGMDGYEFARRLRGDANGRIPFLVALTGYGRDEDRAAAREAGFDQHLIKPPDLDRLEKILAKAP